MERERELRLLERLKEGDGGAFDEIYAAHRARLYSFLVRMSRSHEVAEDLLQETWLRLATKSHLLREDTRLGAWLFRVARNLLVSYMRNRLLDAERTGELGRATLRQQEEHSPFESAAAGETERRLERAVASLPLRYREALLLVAVEGLTHDEAAAICEVGPEAFRKRLSRARAMVDAELERDGGDA